MAERSKTGDTPVAPILDRQPDFDIFLRTVKAEDVEGRPVLTVTASSDEIDLGSDRFTLSALSQMEKAFESLTIFLNHKYVVPEDVFGIVTRAALINREGHTDLDLTIAVENKNERAITVYEMIRNGTHLGVSVGVLVLDADYADEQVMDRQVLEITSIVPLEASIVGIPANRRSWVQGALKAASALASGQRINPTNSGKGEGFRKITILDGPLGMPIEGDDDMPDNNETLAWAVVEEGLHQLGIDLVIAGAVGGHSPPTNDRDQSWDGSAAKKRLRAWASSDGSGDKDKMTWSKYRTGFVWFDSDDAENFGAYKAPHHDILDGSFKTHFRGVVAAAVVIQGGRGGLNIPEGDVSSVKSHIARHYHQYDEKAPWERESSAGWLDIETDVAAELGVLLPDFADIGTKADDDDGEATKSLREEIAAEEFTDRFYTLFRATYYALYEIIASETPVDVKRGEAQKVLNDFAVLAREMVDETLAVLSAAPEDEFDSIQEDLAHGFKAAWESIEANHSLPAGDLEAVGSLVNQVTKAEDANAMLTYKKAELEQDVEAKTTFIAACGEAIRKVMALPMARKIVPERLAEDIQAIHPYLAAPIAEDLAKRKAAATKKKADRST